MVYEDVVSIKHVRYCIYGNELEHVTSRFPVDQVIGSKWNIAFLCSFVKAKNNDIFNTDI